MRLSVFIACKNHERFIEEAAETCLNQTRKPDEMILINDGSRDLSHRKMLNIQSSFPDRKITIINHFYSIGHIAAYNEGIKRSSGDIIHLMAADDRLATRKFYETGMEALKDPSVGFVTGKLMHMDAKGFVDMQKVAGPSFGGKQESLKWLNEMKQVGNIVCGGAVLVRRSLQEAVGGYEKQLPYSADFLNWIKILERCEYAYAIPEIVYHYRRHTGQMTASSGANYAERAYCQRELEEALHNGYLDRMNRNMG
jgi:glycosyltransferase involved in cell wall biosynthesis